MMCAWLTHRHTDTQTNRQTACERLASGSWTTNYYFQHAPGSATACEQNNENRCTSAIIIVTANPQWYSDNLRRSDLWRVSSYHTVRRRRKVKPSNVLVNKPVNGFTRNDLSYTTERCGIRGTMQSHSDEEYISSKRSTTPGLPTSSVSIAGDISIPYAPLPCQFPSHSSTFFSFSLRRGAAPLKNGGL